jgi:2-hydroxychromene-2-carboxylate isomerase
MPKTGSIKLYFDYKSPFAFLAMQPAFDLPRRFDVEVQWIPYLLRIKGRGERSVYSEWKARYSYMDARRWANRRGGFPIKGPQKVYDSTASLIGGLYAQENGFFRSYTEEVYARFFKRELEIDVPREVADLVETLGHPGADYLEWAKGEGRAQLERCIEEGHADHIFGVPIFLFETEIFWGHDRIPLLEERLAERDLKIPTTLSP